jgi:acetyltransferase-like isoleucine patch superfamily enzyme
MIGAALKLMDPMRIVGVHRTLQFKARAFCGTGFKATERACIFPHGAARSSINFGSHACIDGTVEVYDRGCLTVGSHFFLGRSRLYCAHKVTIGNYVLVSDNVSIMDSDLHPIKASRRRDVADAWAVGTFPDVYADTAGAAVTIDDDVWIGFGAAVLKGVTIGRGAIVGAGSLVTSDVRPWTVVAGSPAREIRELKEDER